VQASTAQKQASAEQELAQSIGDLMKHLLSHTGGDFFQAVDDLQLSFTQIKAAQLLAEAEEPLSLGAVGDHLKLSLPAVSRAVDGLFKRGLCTREEDPADRRSKRIVITARGRRLYERLHEIRVAGIREWAAGLDRSERDALLEALRPIAKELR
jgi:MarR family transcriptional regulator for hemolysin